MIKNKYKIYLNLKIYIQIIDNYVNLNLQSGIQKILNLFYL